MKKRLLTYLFLFPCFALANQETLSIDTPLPSEFELVFPNDTNLQPEESEFRVLDFVLMSNEKGERWVVVTLKNEASGRRTFNHKHIMGLLADGTRLHPRKISQSFVAKESLSVIIDFGPNKFPLLRVYSRLAQ
ncbi:hypothetical protein PN836_018820 [Ningiella sp. W23]|uniref:hypothetical protein n=1 Tax=Ningiella sp. W23 TaxID=3023715 RepID=UPI00375755B6